MDTNRNNGQNYQINAFNKGMNTDTALDAVDEGQYIFGLNIRIANNTLLIGNIDPNSKEGLVTPVEDGVSKNLGMQTVLLLQEGETIDRILATASIGNTGVVIFARKFPQIIQQGQEPVDTNEAQWLVYRIDNEPTGFVSNLLYASDSLTTKNKFSVVINKEQEDIIKLYIADGDHGIMQLFVKNGEDPKEKVLVDGQDVWVVNIKLLNRATSEDDLVSGKYFPSDKATIVGTTSGRLKTQQVQYTYRFYKRFGIASKLAPLTNKILIINSNRNVEEGNAENTRTNLGMKLRIALTEDVKKLFDHLQLIRVSYVVAGQVPEIEVVKDLILPDDSQLDIIDTGEEPLEELSLDEFYALNTQSIIPQCIELNQGFMFAANIKDATVFPVPATDLPGYSLYQESSSQLIQISGSNQELLDIKGRQVSGKKVSWEMVCADISLCDKDLNANETFSINNVYSLRKTSSGFDQILNNHPALATIVDRVLGTLSIDETRDLTGGYENIFGSSLFRSLARGETYTYGVVFFKKDGSRSDVICIDDITVPTEAEFPSWVYNENDNCLHAYPIGIKFVFSEFPEDVVGYEIVNKQKSIYEYNNLLQCALARPVDQPLYELSESPSYRRSPFYPTPFLTTEYCLISHAGSGSNDAGGVNLLGIGKCTNTTNNSLFLAFAPEILFRRQDLLGRLLYANTSVLCLSYVNDLFDDILNIEKTSYYRVATGGDTNMETKTAGGETLLLGPMVLFNSTISSVDLGLFIIYPHLSGFLKEKKSLDGYTIKMFKRSDLKDLNYFLWSGTSQTVNINTTPIAFQNILASEIAIMSIKDVKNPLWDSGFTNIEANGANSEISQGVKAYKSYSTSIKNSEYVNWICSGMYNLPIYSVEAAGAFSSTDLNASRVGDSNMYRVYTDTILDYYDRRGRTREKTDVTRGWIGPGPICFLLNLDQIEEGRDHVLNTQIIEDADFSNVVTTPGTVIVNIINNQVEIPDYDHREYFTYTGCGNYTKLVKNDQGAIVSGINTYVFDGDRYITPCEFVTLFKAYDFKSVDDSLDSSQVVYYVPLESKINTFFDYGMNYRNTKSKNLLLEPGLITGITTLDRPLHQYNQIYSDNLTSVVTYVAQAIETHTDTFPQRIYYSQHKDNGEQIESWNIFKPVDYIDADTRYGEITNLLSANDTIFFWQDRAFGKLSVNERSLVTDNNNNTIQLGQGGVLQRTDYLSTKYGMRPEDYSAINTEQGLFWIDILNKAIVANTKDGVINYGEQLNVQNLINKRMSDNKPEIDYDLQNSELLCKCFDNGNQLVFNIKYNIATSVYTRDYDKVLYFNNVMYALKGYDTATQLNYLNVPGENEEPLSKLSPTILLFVVNSNPSQTKVFDNQKIVVAAKDYTTPYTQQLEFRTDANAGTSSVSLGWLLDNPLPFGRVTDRETNICYAVPRETTTDSHPQLRMRGKWMTVKITDNHPEKDFAISHIITKFRQSYS